MSSETPTAPGRPGLRVATIPFAGDHAGAYAAAVLPPGTVRVGPDRTPSPWLDGEYLAAHAGEIDVLHLHGGYAHLSPAALDCWSDAVRRAGVPLVVTVHELDAAGAARLAAVLENAEMVLTLTPGAADEIAERFGRTAIVVAHPSPALPVPGLGAERGLVGLVLGPAASAGPAAFAGPAASARPAASAGPAAFAGPAASARPAASAGQAAFAGPAAAADPAALVRAALSGAVSGGGRLRVLSGPGAPPPAVRAMAAEDEIELVSAAPGDPGWVAELQQLHVAVLPERPRTHSRDLEICRDVGTRVVAPGGGWFADQWSEVVTYGDERGLDPVSLSAAVAAALTRPMPRPADRGWREEQRAAVQRVHAQVYAQVAADRVPG